MPLISRGDLICSGWPHAGQGSLRHDGKVTSSHARTNDHRVTKNSSLEYRISAVSDWRTGSPRGHTTLGRCGAIVTKPLGRRPMRATWLVILMLAAASRFGACGGGGGSGPQTSPPPAPPPGDGRSRALGSLNRGRGSLEKDAVRRRRTASRRLVDPSSGARGCGRPRPHSSRRLAPCLLRQIRVARAGAGTLRYVRYCLSGAATGRRQTRKHANASRICWSWHSVIAGRNR